MGWGWGGKADTREPGSGKGLWVGGWGGGLHGGPLVGGWGRPCPGRERGKGVPVRPGAIWARQQGVRRTAWESVPRTGMGPHAQSAGGGHLVQVLVGAQLGDQVRRVARRVHLRSTAGPQPSGAPARLGGGGGVWRGFGRTRPGRRGEGATVQARGGTGGGWRLTASVLGMTSRASANSAMAICRRAGHRPAGREAVVCRARQPTAGPGFWICCRVRVIPRSAVVASAARRLGCSD